MKMNYYKHLVALTALLTIMSSSVFAYDFMVDNIAYRIISSTELTCETTTGSNIVNQTVNIPATVTYKGKELRVIGIGDGSFDHLAKSDKKIKYLTIAKGITYIGERAFCWNQISEIVIPNTVVEIRPEAFHYAHYTYDNLNKPYSLYTKLIIEDGTSMLYGTGTNLSVSLDYPFRYTHLYDVYIGRSINKNLLGDALYSIQYLEIGDKVTYLSEETFTPIYLQDSFTALEELTIGKGLNRVPYFKEGSNLRKIYVRSRTPQPSGGFESSTYVNATLYVPRGTKSLYQNASVWNKFWTIEEYDVKSDDDVLVTGITLNETSTTMAIGTTKQLTPTISPSNATNQSVSWSSSNTSVASVNSSGEVKAVGKGTATITCKANDGSGKQATCEVTVKLTDNSIFTAKTVEGIEMTFFVESISSGECRVYSETPHSSIDYDTKGTVTIPEEVEGLKVTEIGEQAFEWCGGITKVVIPKTVKKIESFAFTDCNSLTTITGLDQLEYVGGYAFNSYGSSPSIPWFENLPDGVVYIGKVLYCYKGTIPDNTRVEVKEGIRSIGYEAFKNCKGLVGITIPKSVETIDYGIFQGCYNLASIIVTSDNPIYDSRDNSNGIIETSTNTLKHACKNTSIPKSVRYISDAYIDSGITEISIPNNVWTIDGFRDNKDLKKLTLSSSPVYIDYCAFYDCFNLTEIYSYCTSPMSIDERAFKNSGYSNNDVIYETATLYVPIGTKTVYQTTDGWKKFKNIVELESLGINGVNVKDDNGSDNNVYNLRGQRLSTPQKGLNIINGKKVVVK